MQRGRTQVLFRYLPECIVDHSDTQTIGKVAKFLAREVHDVNEDRLLQEIDRRMPSFRLSRTYPPTSSGRSYAFLEPTLVELDLFPLTFECRTCRRISRFDSIDQMTRIVGRTNYRCQHAGCEGVLDQIDLVHYHTCGKVKGLEVGRCSNHGSGNIFLVKFGSDSPSKWRWVCGDCRGEVGSIRSYCQDCNEFMKTAPFRKSDVHYPHSVTMINIRDLTDSGPEKKLLMGEYLGLIQKGDREHLLDVAKSDERNKRVEDGLADLKSKGMPDSLLEEVRKKFGSPSETERNEIIAQIDELVTIQGAETLSATSAVQEYLDTLNFDSTFSLSDVHVNAKKTGNPFASIISEYPDKLKTVGIQNAYVIGDLPVVSAVFGYTRGSVNPTDCILRSFPQNDQYPGKTPIYTIDTKSEAILLQLDREAVLRWLEKNNVVSGTPIGLGDPAQKAWFINNVHLGMIPIYDEIPDDDMVTKTIYRLIHSISHALLVNVASLIGLDKNSLSEMIIPNIPCFLLYCNHVNDFQLGGMFTLFENSIIPWVDMTVESIRNCLYDPVCLESGASCHACLQTSEITCTHFNKDLGRDVLIGNDEIRGFWEHLYS